MINDPQSCGPIVSPNASIIALLCALSNPNANIENHQKALSARDEALSSSPTSYSNICLQFTYVMSCPTLQHISPTELEEFRQRDPPSFMQLSHDPSLWNKQFRVMAGLLLKNALVRPPIHKGYGSRMKLTIEACNEIKQKLLKCIVDNDNQGVRNAASSCVAMCSLPLSNLPLSHAAFPLEEWPELVPFLLRCCSNQSTQIPSLSVGQGALGTLKKLLEDNTNSPVLLQCEDIIPTLLHILQSPIHNDPNQSPKMLELSLQCLHTLIEPLPSSLVLHMKMYLQILSMLSTHQSHTVQVQVCKTISTLLAIRSEYLQPHIASIAQFMLNNMKSSNDLVAHEACEFWLQYVTLDEESYSPILQSTLVEIYPRLVPLLLHCMVYSDDKIQDILYQNQEALQQESDPQNKLNPTTLPPIFHRSKAAQRSSHATKMSMKLNNENIGKGSDDDDDDDDDSTNGADPNVDDDDDEWTVRKCAAATLDSLSVLLPPSIVLPPLLPLLQAGLSGINDNNNSNNGNDNNIDKNPWIREASILALGAIASGCHTEMTQSYLPQLHPYLIQQIQNEPLPQIRCIACWTLSRYADWTLLNTEAFTQTCGSILNLLSTDPNAKVRYAACSSFGFFVEASCNFENLNYSEIDNAKVEDTKNPIIPLLQPIFQHLILGLEKSICQGDIKGVTVICDTLSIMAECIGQPIGLHDLPSIYVPPLLHIWEMAASSGSLLEKNLLPLVEAMASISLAIGQNFQPWALHVFENCMQTIEACIMDQASKPDEKRGDEDYDPMICATDCLDGMVEGLSSSFVALVLSSQKYGHHFLGMLHNLLKHDFAGVRMSSFALLGDLARKSPSVLEEGISQLMKEGLQCCDETQYPSVCNNATWAIGEICIQCVGHDGLLNGLKELIVEKLGQLLMAEQYGDGKGITGLSQNAAASMGRMAMVDPSVVGRELDRFFIGWCEGLASIVDPLERHDGFKGLILAIHSNPAAIVSPPNPIDPKKLTSIIFAIVSWHIPADENGVPTFTYEMANGVYSFESFPEEYRELGSNLCELLHSIRKSITDEDWKRVEGLPRNIGRLLNEVYQL